MVEINVLVFVVLCVLAVMASPGQLFLLLVVSSLLLSSVCAHVHEVRSKRNAKEKVRGVVNLARGIGLPFLGIIEVYGGPIAAAADFALGKILGKDDEELLNTMKSEFKSLNTKIETFHNELKLAIDTIGIRDLEVKIKTV